MAAQFKLLELRESGKTERLHAIDPVAIWLT